MGLFDSLTNIGNMMPKIDTENPPEKLDKVEKKLDALKDQIKGKEVEKVVGPLKEAFVSDLKEAGIDDESEQGKYWGEVETFVKSEIAKDTIEFKEIENLVNNTESLKVLKETLASKDPLAKAKKWIERIRAIPIFGAWILGFAHDTLIGWSKNKEGKDNPGAEEMRNFAALLVDKKDTKPKTPEEEAKSKEKELVDSMKKKFSEKSMTLEEASITQGLDALAKDGFKDEENEKKLTNLVDSALAESGNLMKLYKEIQGKEKPTAKFPFRITDLRFVQNFSKDEIKILVDAISKDEKAKFAPKEDSVVGVRAFLDAALKMEKDGKLEDAIKDFPAPAAPIAVAKK